MLILNWISFYTGMRSRTDVNIFLLLYIMNPKGELFLNWLNSRTKRRLTLIPPKEFLKGLALNPNKHFLRKNSSLNRKKNSRWIYNNNLSITTYSLNTRTFLKALWLKIFERIENILERGWKRGRWDISHFLDEKKWREMPLFVC